MDTTREARRGRVRWQILVFVVGFGILGTAICFRPSIRSRAADVTQSMIDDVAATVDKGESGQAILLAESTVERAKKTETLLGPALVVLGRAYELQASQSEGQDRQFQALRALRHYQEAEAEGLDAELTQQLTLHRGKSLVLASKFNQAIPLLKSCLGVQSTKVECLKLIVESYGAIESEDLTRSFAYLRELWSINDLPADTIRWVWTTRRHLLKQARRNDPLNAIQLSSNEFDLSWVVKLLEAVDLQAQTDFSEAALRFGEVATLDQIPIEVERRARFLAAWNTSVAGNASASVDQFERIVWEDPDSTEARAAALHLVGHHSKNNELSKATSALIHLVRQPEDNVSAVPGLWSPRLTTRAVRRVSQTLVKQRQFELSERLLTTYSQSHLGGDSLEMLAELYRSWAEYQWNESDLADPRESPTLKYDAESKFRRSGQTFDSLAADSEVPMERAKYLWKAAEMYFRGQGYIPAIESLRSLAGIEVASKLHPEALAALSASLERIGRYDDALQAAAQCLGKHPESAAAVDARISIARCTIHKAEKEQVSVPELKMVESLLSTNLSLTTVNADPQFEIDNRLLMAQVLERQARHEDSLAHLTSILRLNPAPHIEAEVQVMSARAYRRAAQTLLTRANEGGPSAARTHYLQQRDEHLNQALTQLLAARNFFKARGVSPEATVDELTSYLESENEIAITQYERGSFQDAIDNWMVIVKATADRTVYMNSVLNIANSYDQLGQRTLAIETIKDLKQEIAQWHPDQLEETRVGMKARWKEYEGWQRRLF